MDEPQANTNSQNSPQPELGRSHHLSPYSIFCAWPRGQHPNVILSRDSQVRVLKFLKLGLPQLWRPITSCADPPIEVRSKAKLYLLLKAFQQYVAHHLHASKSGGGVLILNGRKSNWQFNSQPFFWP
jgi:hypothetical protein